MEHRCDVDTNHRIGITGIGVDELCFYFGPLCFIFMLEISTYYAFVCTHYAFSHNDYAFLQTIILNAAVYNAVKKS